jgi:hypothetical protein
MGNAYFLMIGPKGDVLAVGVGSLETSQLGIMLAEKSTLCGIDITGAEWAAEYRKSFARFQPFCTLSLRVVVGSLTELEDLAEQGWGHNKGNFVPRPPRGQQQNTGGTGTPTAAAAPRAPGIARGDAGAKAHSRQAGGKGTGKRGGLQASSASAAFSKHFR